MVDHELMQIAQMVSKWREKNRIEFVNVTSSEDSEFAFGITVYDREDNHYMVQGACNGRDDRS